jgi:RNA polymerase sigma factor (TIGR02999 family)
MYELDHLLQQAHQGNDLAREQLFAHAYEELRTLAHAQLRNGGRETLEATELLHESYLRFRKAGQFGGAESRQFFSYAARVMRSVIVDFARQRRGQRRGHGFEHVALSPKLAESVGMAEDEMIRVSDALDALQKHDVRLARVVEMRYLAGMTESETAAALGVTDRTVQRYWEKAKVVLSALLR